MVTAPPEDGSGIEEVTRPNGVLPNGTRAATANPFASQTPELKIGGDKPFLQLAVEGFCMMFWPSEDRQDWMFQNLNMTDPLAGEFKKRSMINCEPGNNTPTPPTMRRMAVTSSGESSVVDSVFRDADELYMRTLIEESRAMHAGFTEAAATGAATETAAITRETIIGAPAPA